MLVSDEAIWLEESRDKFQRPGRAAGVREAGPDHHEERAALREHRHRQANVLPRQGALLRPRHDGAQGSQGRGIALYNSKYLHAWTKYL